MKKIQRKITAAVMLAAFSASSVTPVYANTPTDNAILLYKVSSGTVVSLEPNDELLKFIELAANGQFTITTLEGKSSDEGISFTYQDQELDENTYLIVNLDTNGDGVPDLNIDTNGDGVPDINVDLDGDGIPDVLNDADGDGLPDDSSESLPVLPSTSTDGDQSNTLEPSQPTGDQSVNEQPDPGVPSDETPGEGEPVPDDNVSQPSDPSGDANTPSDTETPAEDDSVEPDSPVEQEPSTPDDNTAADENENGTQDGDTPDQEVPNEPAEDEEPAPEPDTPTVPAEPDPVPSPEPTQPSTPAPQPPVTNNTNPPSITITPPSQDTSGPSSSTGGSSSVEENAQNSVVYKGPVKSWTGVDPHSNRYKLKEAAEAMLGWHYSQAIRMTDGYRDCSSFVYTAISDAGFAPPVSWAWTTYTMPSYTDIVYQIPMSDLRPGDIVLGDGHVAFYWGNDALGSPMTLECCGTFGVCYGYMMCNGWDFPYTSAWRIRGIDGNDPNYTYSGETGTSSKASVSKTSAAAASSRSGSAGSHSNSSQVSSAASSEAISFKTVTTADLPEAQTIVITPDKLNGNVIDLLDLEIDPVFALQMYLDKYLEQIDLETMQGFDSSSDQLKYLIGKAIQSKGVETGQLLANYIGDDIGTAKAEMKNVVDKNTQASVASLL